MSLVVLPKAYYLLLSLKEVELSKNVQHPLAIWNSSYNKVIVQFIKLLDIVEKSAGSDEYDSEILYLYESLLAALCKFWGDDTDEILKSFISSQKIGKDKTVQSFKKRSKDYLTHPSKILNKIKHNQRILFSCNAYIDGNIVPGFFVAMNKGGKYLPCSEVHWKDNKAFSFFYELRRFLVGLYQHGDSLAQAIRELNPTLDSVMSVHCQRQGEIVSRVDKLPSWCFPNELSGSLHVVDYSKGLIRNDMTQCFCGKIFPWTEIKTEIIYSADGITRSYEIIKLDWSKFKVL